MFKEVSKLVFLILSVALVVAFLFEIYLGIITIEWKDFYALILMVFTFFFTKAPATADEIATGTAK